MVVLLLASHWRRKKSVLIRAQTKNDGDSITPGFYRYWKKENPNFLGILEASFEESYPNLPCLEPVYTRIVYDGVC